MFYTLSAFTLSYQWAISITLSSIVFGIAIHFSYLWQQRKITSAINACLIGLSTGLLAVSVNFWLAILICIIQSYRLLAVLRIVQNRINADQLNKRSLRSELTLSTCLLALIAIDAFLVENLSLEHVLYLASGLQLLTAAVFYRHARHMLVRTTAIFPKKFTPDAELPTITVAIPARNETTQLTECLRNILKSDYPKLEVLVLDDCSQDKSSDIIRKFAHRGVRFIKGTQPPSKWVAKNHAYDQLLDTASGKYILFCGIDIRFEPNSLRQMTEIMLKQHKNMLSILPLRNGPIDKHFLVQPMRYWRELAIPRLSDKTPPVLSSCWMANRQMLIKHGGFEALRKTIRPERFIARGVEHEGHYTFLRASSGIYISSVKNLPAQWATAIRTRYPEQHNQPESVCWASLWQSFIFLGPLITILLAISNGVLFAAALSLLAASYLLATHQYVHMMTNGRFSIRPLILYPISVLMELAVLNYSMWAYEFSVVIWKGRNVCLPVLQTNLRLPRLD